MTVGNFEEGLEFIKQRYEEPNVKKALKDFDKVLEITCADTERQFLIVVHKDQGIEIQDNTGDPDAPVKIRFKTEDVLMKLLNKEIGAVKAYDSGAVKVVQGDIKSLLKMRKLLF
ncbi:MAG TPA: SCP2 sterol-binding domain-containing protein [Candidatus Lokiarchaeia archaeon]|nr:SCP2 sterol-binding domain-containing protein [Candidatus Lokiarchaeia archaeon]